MADVDNCNWSPTFILLTSFPIFLNGTTIFTASLVNHDSLPPTSNVVSPALTVVTPAWTPQTVPAATVTILVSAVLYTTFDFSGYTTFDGSSSYENVS